MLETKILVGCDEYGFMGLEELDPMELGGAIDLIFMYVIICVLRESLAVGVLQRMLRCCWRQCL